ncbi:hypothetical protein LIER_43384 [Lithospermum erythrorhizon]|uniref:Uncharacterized protein n=1 Tax=Lithospermum erythrorhizon TaxID=34254 RepID=A0AAV3Q107_LITER
MNNVGKVFANMPQPALNGNSGVYYVEHMFDNLPQQIPIAKPALFVSDIIEGSAKKIATREIRQNISTVMQLDGITGTAEATSVGVNDQGKFLPHEDHLQQRNDKIGAAHSLFTQEDVHEQLEEGISDAIVNTPSSWADLVEKEENEGKQGFSRDTGASATHQGGFSDTNFGTDFARSLEGSGLQQGNETVPLIELQIVESKAAQMEKLTV